MFGPTVGGGCYQGEVRVSEEAAERIRSLLREATLKFARRHEREARENHFDRERKRD